MRSVWSVILVALVSVASVAVSQEGGPGEDGLHDAWDALLRAHVKQGLVDYEAIKWAPEALDGYLAQLANAEVRRMSSDEKLAYWINAYNAFTVRLIVDNLPIKSIRDISSPWKQKRWLVGETLYSLDTIEHEILREEFREPRIHFAIVCASIGCPDLQRWAYRGRQIDAQLDRVTREFMNSPKHLSVTTDATLWGRESTVLQISKIFKWFGGDFTDGGKRSVYDFILLYTHAAAAESLKAAQGKVKIRYLDYDWLLNTSN